MKRSEAKGLQDRECFCSSPHWHVPVLPFRSQSVVEAGTLKHEDLGESENTQPLLALD